MSRKLVIAPSLLAVCLLIATNSTAEISARDYQLFVTQKGGRVDFVFNEHRPFRQCHASTLVQAADGTLLCAWFGGTREKDPDVGIWLSRFDGKKWEKPAQVAKINDTAHWNPVLFRDTQDTVYLFFKAGAEIASWQQYWMQSTDAGRTWTAPVELVPGDKGGRGPVRCKPILLASGAWLAGASTEHWGWKAFADRSEDRGKTWTRTEDFAVDRKVLKGTGAIQPTLWESAPGKIHALLRSAAGTLWRTDSEDDGRTWSPVYATRLPNPNSGIDALQLEDGRLLLVYNPTGGNWGARTPLDLAVSTDNGANWSTIAHLEDDPHPDNEFSYPAIVRTRDGIAITYTWQRERIRCWQIPLEALTPAP